MNEIRTNLRKLLYTFRRRAASGIGPSFASGLAQVLKWQDEPWLTKTQAIQKKDLSFNITQASIGEHPALFFVGHRKRQSNGVINNAALYAYHSAVEWGIVTNFAETVVFNSHWVKNNEWYRFPSISSAQLLRNVELLDALTPKGIRTGRIDDLAYSQVKPDAVIVPVDDKLVDSLDVWRDEALRFAKSPRTLDARLQNLFAQLFVLRAVEDRGLSASVPHLQTAIDGDGSLDIEKLKHIFQSAQRHIQSELFDKSLPRDIPDFVLKGIIEDLYRPREFPIPGVRYNFSWIEADVLGRAYEKYLSTVLVPSKRKDPQQLLFDQPLRDVQRKTRRKAGGVYYTPEFIVRYLTEKALDSFFAKRKGRKSLTPRVVDMSCGSGSFLRAVADSLIHRLRQVDPNKNWGRELVTHSSIVGIDIDPKAATLARLSLWLRLTEEPNPLPLPRLNKNIICGDSLKSSTWNKLPNQFDIVLGNPPFLAVADAPISATVRKTFRSAKGRFDFSSLFVEQALNKLKKGGFLGYVIPNRLFKNTYASTIRELLAQRTRILTIVDFGSTEVFSGISTYVGLICAEKSEGSKEHTKVRVIELSSLSPRFPGVFLASGDSLAKFKTPNVDAYDAHHPTGGEPWNLLSENAIRIRIKLQSDNPTLGTIATVVQGIKTGANDIFVVTLEDSSGPSLCEVLNGLGERHLIERDLLHPVVYGSEIRRYDVVRLQRFIIYPYLRDEVVAEGFFRNKYPRTYQYLKSYDSFLRVRSGISRTSCAWYELVRKRQSSWLEARKLVIRDMATRPSFAIDTQGGTFLIGGTAVVPADQTLLEPLLAFLNSRISEWYLRKSSPAFRGGYSKFEPNAIQEIPVPQLILESDSLRTELVRHVRTVIQAVDSNDATRQRVAEYAIDELLTRKLGISLEDID